MYNFHVEALFKMSSIESCPRGHATSINGSTCGLQRGRKTSPTWDRASQKWTSSFHESTAEYPVESRSVLDTPLYYHSHVSVSS